MMLICPVCRAAVGQLDSIEDTGAACAKCRFALTKEKGIVRALAPDRRAFYQQFLSDYRTIRSAEGRGSDSPGYYLALPFEDKSGRHADQWRIRARTYRYFESKLLPRKSVDILDLGAGNGWMSYRLSLRGHRPVAVDIFVDERDGLAAARHYERFPCVEAEFDRLPFA